MPEPPRDWTPYLGRKVSIRYALRGDPEHPFSEAIGVIASIATDADGVERLVLFDRRGTEKRVAVRDVLAAKVFPAGGEGGR